MEYNGKLWKAVVMEKRGIARRSYFVYIRRTEHVRFQEKYKSDGGKGVTATQEWCIH